MAVGGQFLKLYFIHSADVYIRVSGYFICDSGTFKFTLISRKQSSVKPVRSTQTPFYGMYGTLWVRKR